MSSIKFHNLENIYWRPINLNIIGNQLEIKKTPFVFDNGMSFTVYDCLKNIKDITFNNKNGIFLTDLNNNKTLIEDKNTPDEVGKLSLIESPLALFNNNILDVVNDNLKQSNTSYTSLTSYSNDVKLRFTFVGSKVFIEQCTVKQPNGNNLVLTNKGINQNVKFELQLTPYNNTQLFDYIINEEYITLFESGTNYSKVIKIVGGAFVQLSQLDLTGNLPSEAIFILPTIKNNINNDSTVSNSFLVKYESNPLLNQKELVVKNKSDNYNQNYLGVFPSENFTLTETEANCDLYFHGLKNYQNTEYAYTSASINRTYNKIYTGSNQIKGLENIHLGYQTNTIKIEFKPDTTTDFYFSPTSNIISIQDAGLIEDGAVGGAYPFTSDRIYTYYRNLTQNINGLNLNTPIVENNRWLCSWLKKTQTGTYQTGIETSYVWLDRYYNSAYYTIDQAMSATSMIYHNKIDPNLPYVYDVASETKLIPSVAYKYHHIGIEDNKAFVNNIDFDYVTLKNQKILSITNWLSSPLMDDSVYNNYGLLYNNNITLKKDYVDFDGKNYALFPSNEILLRDEKITASLWVNVDDWNTLKGYQIFGNFDNSGIGLINESQSYSPIITILNNSTSKVYNLNYRFGLISENTINTKNINFTAIQRMPDYSYWIFGNNTTSLSALKYDANNKLISNKPIVSNLTRVDQVEMDSLQNLYLYDNTLKDYIVLDQHGNINSNIKQNQNVTLTSSTKRIEIDLEDKLIAVYGNASVIDNNNNLWETIGENLYKNKQVYATVGKSKQLSCDNYNNVWILTKNNDYIKINPSGSIDFSKTFSLNYIPDNNCLLPSTYEINNPDYLKEDAGNYPKTITVPVIGDVSNNINTDNIRYINFVNSPIQGYTNSCTLSSEPEDQMILMDNKTNEIFLINQLGEPITKLNFNGLIKTGEALNFIANGDFTGYQYLRKYKVNTRKLCWKIQIADPSDIENTSNTLSLDYVVSTLPRGWHHFSMVFDSSLGSVIYYIDSIEVDRKTFNTDYRLDYTNKTSFLLAAATIKNSILNSFVNSLEGYKFIGSVSDLRMYSIALKQHDIERIYFSSPYSKQSKSLNWNMKIGNRNYVEEIKNWFQFQLPASKSKYYNINIHNLNVDDKIKENIANAISNIISKISPTYTSLYKINWGKNLKNISTIESNEYYIDDVLTTLDSKGTGVWNDIYYIEGVKTTLDLSGSGVWNFISYVNGEIFIPTQTPTPTPTPTITPTPTPTPTPTLVSIRCNDCVTPTSNDPSTVEYYGYASSPTWCSCVGVGSICNSKLVLTTDGYKLGYYCITEDEPPSEVQCFEQLNGCIYPYLGCIPPYNFIASKVFINPFNTTATASIVGSADDDCLLEYNGEQLWLRSGSSTVPSCDAGGFSYTLSVGPNQAFRLTGYDVLGYCGTIQACVTFSQ
jgi:hypothetical protein